MTQIRLENKLTAEALNTMTTGNAAEVMAQAKLGPKYLPLCPPDHKGVAQQHKADCNRPGKAPLLAKWRDKASDDPNQINRWFIRRPNMNLGMTLGAQVGVVGFDIDGEYGRTKMEQLFRGLITPTWEFTTPGGGSRLLFAVPKGKLLRKLADVNPDADHEELALLADGQMTVIPPSRHQNGGQYRWVAGRGPGDVPLAELPENVIERMRSGQSSSKLSPSKTFTGTKEAHQRSKPAKPGAGFSTRKSLGSDISLSNSELQKLSKNCQVFKGAMFEQQHKGCSEDRWHQIVSMLVRAGFTDAALAFSQLSGKHDSRSKQRILEMDSEGSRATYGPTRCATFGCDSGQISKCHRTVRLDPQTKEPSNSPAAFLLSARKKAISTNKLSVEQYTMLLTENYGINGNNLCNIKFNKEGEPDYKPIANFIARIAKFITKDNGAERVTLYEVDGILLGSEKPLPPVQVPANEFESMKWLPMWGPEPNIFPGNLIRDSVRFAIQSTAVAAIHEQTYAHLGWITIEGKWRYLHAGGAMGAPNVKVELDPRLQNYKLTESPSNPKKDMEASLELLDVAPHRVTLALWGLTYLSPLCEWLRRIGLEPKFLVWLYGYTGSRKTTLAKLFLSHFGDLLEHPPASFKDTANSVEKRGFDAKDSLLLIDDYHPTSSPKEKLSMELLAQQILRGYGDRVARGRMKQDTTLRADYPPRGMAIVTAEDTLSVGSSVARLFPVELLKTDVALTPLTKAQLDAEKLSSAMKGYLEWVGQAMATFEEGNLRELFVEKRHEATKLGVHGRLVEASSWLYLGLHMGLLYAESVGALAEVQGHELRTEAWNVFLDIASEQGQQVSEVRPSERFAAIVSQMLRNKSIHTDDVHREPQPEMVPKNSCHVGWHDDKYYYLLPEVIYNQVSQFLSRQGEKFPISASMLWRQLADSGMTNTEITKEKDKERRHMLVKKTVRGHRSRLLWVKRDSLEEHVGKGEGKPRRRAAIKPLKTGATPPENTTAGAGQKSSGARVLD
ncbi:bifunctional DNA primase/polymerase [Paenibacillus sp. p3-SID867]|uniref:bifunctional DNA primase/polymerase n=1 Tax=Paenibacillus sp. p3-SID867 TaxID=2916363 RepID=UPI0021A3FD22|nr:bifunctional DNA primase/polymerase [Paenibacillus sp. p3-SID867]MCT1398098.1 bifunctional DNA primase/polymerase [Paenibacillus sp. p3-SID867]